ncbi:MAG: DedA family protein [Solirubrobacterales bacterium]|jgi:membrane protein DedA with SNARE-associated domain|nr:DedA family protein [Solirubrobacterales bacterium]
MSLLRVILASLTSTLQDLLAHHGALAVFAVMAVDAVLPVGGELTMLLAGALAAGALGAGGRDGLPEYILLSLAGTAGYAAGSVAGWWIGARGGREFVGRHGRLLHLGPERFARAEAWFTRHGSKAVFLGRLTPLVRSFISIPAGVLEFPLRPYVLLTTLGSAIWCFGFAGAGWALGSNWDQVHHAFRYADVAAILAVAAAAAYAVRAQRRRPA